MIPRKQAKKLLGEYLERLRASAEAGETFLDAELPILDETAEKLLAESDLVLRGTENLEQKARRYVTEGRLRVEKIEPSGLIVASCCGTTATTYQLGFDPVRREWRCTCARYGGSRKRRCSHLAALQLVVEEPQPRGAAR